MLLGKCASSPTQRCHAVCQQQAESHTKAPAFQPGSGQCAECSLIFSVSSLMPCPEDPCAEGACLSSLLSALSAAFHCEGGAAEAHNRCPDSTQGVRPTGWGGPLECPRVGRTILGDFCLSWVSVSVRSGRAPSSENKAGAPRPRRTFFPESISFLPEGFPRPAPLTDFPESPQEAGQLFTPNTGSRGRGRGRAVPFLLEAGERPFRSGDHVFPKKLGRGRRAWEQPPPHAPHPCTLGCFSHLLKQYNNEREIGNFRRGN